MEAILYAEIYLFCIIIVWLCKYWSDQRSSHSASERWLHAALIGFLVSDTFRETLNSDIIYKVLVIVAIVAFGYMSIRSLMAFLKDIR